MAGRGELTDKSWERIAPLLPENGCRGGRWRDHRTVVNGILWKLRTGAPWRDLPGCYGPWQTCYDRFVRWRRDGTWNRLLAHVQTKSDPAGYVTEGPGLSAYALADGVVYRTYVTSARGVEFAMGYYGLLDRTPMGRNEEGETDFWLRRHDEYQAD